MTAIPAVIDDLDEATYFAHPALSVSGAKKILAAPALYRWERDNGQPPSTVFDVGHAAHALVLGVGAEVVVIDAPDWRGKAAKEQRDEARAEGKTPLLAADYRAVMAMADAVLCDPLAGPLFTDGRPEVSLFWRDWVTGVDRRARVDWLPNPTPAGRLALVDLKTAASADPQAIRQAVAKFRYEMQAAWYIDGAYALELGDDIGFRFVFVEKSPPHLVTVVELDAAALSAGRTRNDEALRIFAECQATDVWPGYCDDVQVIALPPWALPNRHDRAA